ncbi:MAG: hypothetical protein L6V93_17735 [Clostridiales bacterium]|nr:MAG: hypothetical protein L6V93_17735 [Clostridiales bacterium]
MANMNLLRQAGYVDGDDNPIFPKTYDELTEFAKTIAQKNRQGRLYYADNGQQRRMAFHHHCVGERCKLYGKERRQMDCNI